MTDLNTTKPTSVDDLMNRITETFSRLDLAAWYECFHQPHIILTPKGGLYAKTLEECEKNMGASFEKLRQQGFVKSTLDYHNIKYLNDTTAVVSAVWSRWDNNNELIQTFGATYVLNNIDGSWGITFLTTHKPDTVLLPD